MALALGQGRRALSALGRALGGGTLCLGKDAEALAGNARLPSRTFAAAPTGFETGPSVTSLRGQSFLVTGSTSGIGLHTSALLAQQGATVLVHGRMRSKVQRLLRDLRTMTGNSRVFGYCYDLSSLDKTRALAAHVRKDLDTFFGGKLDVLVNNAGVFMEDKELTEDGLEMTWAVNVAAPFLLTAELLDAISGRVLNVSSISLADRIDWDNTQAEKGFERMGHAAYGMSKLAGNMWSYRLAKLLATTRHLPVICVDPGTVNTKLLYAGWGDVAYAALPAEEADDVFWAATDPALEQGIGQEVYYVNRKARRSPRFSYDAAAQERLWRLLKHQTGARYNLSRRAA